MGSIPANHPKYRFRPRPFFMHIAPHQPTPNQPARSITFAVSRVLDSKIAGLERRRAVSLWCLVAGAVSLLVLTGCREEMAPRVFEPNLVQAMKYEIKNEFPMEQTSRDVTWAVTRMFGTPDDPKLPQVVTEDDDLASIVSVARARWN